jgi:hypothetical protein
LLKSRIPKETLLLFTLSYSVQGKKVTQNYICLNGELCIILFIFESVRLSILSLSLPPSFHPSITTNNFSSHLLLVISMTTSFPPLFAAFSNVTCRVVRKGHSSNAITATLRRAGRTTL